MQAVLQPGSTFYFKSERLRRPVWFDSARVRVIGGFRQKFRIGSVRSRFWKAFRNRIEPILSRATDLAKPVYSAIFANIFEPSR